MSYQPSPRACLAVGMAINNVYSDEHGWEVEGEAAIKALADFLSDPENAKEAKAWLEATAEKVSITDFYTDHDGPMRGLPVDSLYRVRANP